MSLIPPESFSFPDDFSRSISRARALQERQRHARKTDLTASDAPLRSDAPSPKPKPAPPARAAIVRKPLFGKTKSRAVAIKANARPPGVKPAAPVRLTKSKSLRPADAIVDLAPKPESVATAAPMPRNQPDRILPVAPVQRRRRKRLQRFLTIEIPAVAVLMAAAAAGLTHQFADPIAVTALNIVTILAASVTAITPIAFFAKTPTLPTADR